MEARDENCNCAPGVDGLIVHNSWAHGQEARDDEREARRVRLDHLLGVYSVGSGEWSWQDEYENLIDRPVTQRLLAEVREDGIREPILLGTDGRVWDGHHRITVAMHLGLDSVPVEFAARKHPEPEITEARVDALAKTWLSIDVPLEEVDVWGDRDEWLTEIRAKSRAALEAALRVPVEEGEQ